MAFVVYHVISAIVSSPLMQYASLQAEKSIKSRDGGFLSGDFSSNSESFASELLENLEEMCFRYYVHCDNFNMFSVSSTYHMLPVAKKIREVV